ncbi:GH36-type glycosyl hydrolase domain-containing protein [Desulfitobacterium sp.]|uniref:GH36-type glycosyl hydrolase domain-containing protein n=1 Tax=Desulfitobacterium sp. TaxID=49981 RepID=UPI002CCCBB18|nr:glucoamylase family protein [Desulfitobacterium sp.]HVJ48799.1 glucoamylase family protein [Desulfitobacterium sp.]
MSVKIILNHEELLEYAKNIAHSHLQSGNRKGCSKLFSRVKENTSFLQQAYEKINQYSQKTTDRVPAAEWFLDNYYLLKDLRLEIKQNLPRKYERQLPCIADDKSQYYPRVFFLMRELVIHTDIQISRKLLRDFINAYQLIIPLSSAELWAVPIMLKIIVLENIRCLVEQILTTQLDREEAEHWITPFLQMDHPSEDWEKSYISIDQSRIKSSAYAERLLSKIRELGVDATPLLHHLDDFLSKQEVTIEGLAKSEYQQQAMCQVSMSHAIASIRFLAEEDWPRFFEEISPVQKLLEEDPSGIFLKMDFDSRDKYRHQVEKLARRYQVSEIMIARKLLARATKRAGIGNVKKVHIGFDLLGQGNRELEKELEQEGKEVQHLACQVKRWVRDNTHVCYFGSIFLISMLLLALLAPRLFVGHKMSFRDWVYAIFILVVPVTAVSIPLVNWLVAHFFPPTFFPKLELKAEIPEDLRTVIVIPALLPSVERVRDLIGQLEISYLANQDLHLHFALLGDFKDAATSNLPNDLEIVQAAVQGIEQLNQKYRVDGFFFLNRKRLWNESEKVWMGWERKRGKLLEFNQLLRQEGPTSYDVQIGALEILPKIKYVITLDADTELPRGVAKKLIGTLAHPLQRPRLNEERTRVIEGYGLLQPRVGVSILSAQASAFSSLFSGQTGIDPYTTAVSDVYQDLFGEGIYTGKGIYDVEVFHKVTGKVFPENRILSHDLLEGLYARTGLVTDIELIDGYPSKYPTYIKRLHRWVRGDWQILPWLGKDLPFLAKWKIFDNLRRSLEVPCQVLLILLGFISFAPQPYLWLGFVGFSLFLPHFLRLLDQVFSRRKSTASRFDYREMIYPWIFQASTLFYQALIQFDAIFRSLVRQFITHHNLLEWESAADVEQRLKFSLASTILKMWPVWLGLFIFTGGINAVQPAQTLAFLPVCFIWGVSPFLSYAFSVPLTRVSEHLSKEDIQELRLWSRRIWAFFEDYVTRQENWLPPDNVQVDPPNGIAHRTSPTNIGLAMLSNLAAFELGYQTVDATLDRIEGSLTTLEKMEQWKGHFYNWYDTLTLQPLQPRYISTVDSGNLVVYLMTLSQGLRTLGEESLLQPMISGLTDTFQLVREHMNQGGNEEQLAGENDWTSLAKTEFPKNVWSLHTSLEKWEQQMVEGMIKNAAEEGLFWIERLKKMLSSFNREIAQFYPIEEENNLVQADLEGTKGKRFETLSLIELLEWYQQKVEQMENAQDVRIILEQKIENLQHVMSRTENLSTRIRELALNTNFQPLYASERQLFSIGYRVEEGTRDRSYYDLLASEARQASFMAIAKGDVSQAHWFRLGRTLTQVKGRRSLVSWSGTMFEFMMPLLLMQNYPGTLLDETYHSVVEIQRLYGLEKGIPWGISESGYSTLDLQLNYQYKAFGVPGLGLKRGLVQELVIAPYATFLALLIEPQNGVNNLRRMAGMGFASRYGLYEAVDFTRERISLKQNFQIVKSYMAHHQGMSFLALSNVLLANRMQHHFHADPLIQATELLLQERLPRVQKIVPPPETARRSLEGNLVQNDEEDRFISYPSADTLMPLTHFVANGEYSVMMTNAGSGFSRFKGLAVSRWREDVTCDDWGMYFYIQNLNSGNFWSATHQPCQDSGEDYRVTYAPDRIEYFRKDGNISTKMEVVVSPEDPVETRRLSLTNHSQYERVLEVTSYFEVVLLRPQDELAHPAFANLFIETEFVHQALIASRRPRNQEEARYWLMQTVALEGKEVANLQYETDRGRFLGRGGSIVHPQALELNQPLSNSTGAVLDPILSLRQRVSIKPGQTAKISFSTGIAATREAVMQLAEKYREPSVIDRVFELSWTQSQMELKHLNLTAAQANDALSLGSQVLYLSPRRRDYAERLSRNTKGQSSLWPYAVSGDLPMILVLLKKTQHLDFVRQLLIVHEYWRMKGLYVDLVILNQDETGYMQTLQDMLQDLVAVGHARDLINQAGGIYLLQERHMSEEDVNLLHSVARVVFNEEEGSCAVQLRKQRKRVAQIVPSMGKRARTVVDLSEESTSLEKASRFEEQSQLLYFNGYGGYNREGSEYIIWLRDGKKTPLPWINVIANPHFGFQVSENGAGYTWSGNSRENKLTPWSNDPILDSPGEALYIQEDQTGMIWSPTPSPIREQTDYEVCHGQGYSVFRHRSHDLEQEMFMFVPLEKPLKIMKLTLKNQAAHDRNFTLTYYVEWVMGIARELSAPFIVTEYDEEHSALLARNSYQEEFAQRIAFLSACGSQVNAYTGDRTEFIGRNGDLSHPKALMEKKLSGNTGAGFDPCGVLQYKIKLAPAEKRSIYFILGEGGSLEETQALLTELQNEAKIEQAFQEVQGYWQELLGRVTVRTPEKSLDLLLNRWLLYQTIVCRLWARSAFYQSGGAFGFRDQLQDVMALTLVAPEKTRSQILLHCAHQFSEGDVQHWWHAEKSKGIRTKFSDDLLWLPFVTADYLEHTQDKSLLEEVVSFLDDQPLGEEEDERYSIPQLSTSCGTVYEHCIRAIERSLKLGEHGLPLIGSGDWNDGFSRVGVKGKGESVWLGWFLITTLDRFASVCEENQELERAERYRQIALELTESIEKNAWDGGWYRRAYFDDGTPLGSSRNPECQMDAIAQSWGVISGAARPSRVRDSMTALENYLWRKEDGVHLLLTPPFDHSSLDPGYIKGYVPGVRENGGQYTHGAIWSVLAFTSMGEGSKALQLFNMLNPINHARTPQEVARYKVEPYVMAADVYAVHPHIGRGGWSWYTGAAGWMYQVGIEGILGLSKQGAKLSLRPCIPAHWQGYEIDYHYKSALYRIKVENLHGKMTGVEKSVLDGQLLEGDQINLTDDGKEHWVHFIM